MGARKLTRKLTLSFPAKWNQILSNAAAAQTALWEPKSRGAYAAHAITED